MNSRKRTPTLWNGSGSTRWQRLTRPGPPESAPQPSRGLGTRQGLGSGTRSRQSPPARIWLSLISLLPVLLLATGCSSSRGELVRTEIVRVEVPVQTPLPENLLRPCWPAAAGGTGMEEFAAWVEDLVLTLEACNEDKAAIRALQPRK